MIGYILTWIFFAIIGIILAFVLFYVALYMLVLFGGIFTITHFKPELDKLIKDQDLKPGDKINIKVGRK